MTEQSPKEKILEWMRAEGVAIVADFVPFSRSRNKNEKHKSLNWSVTVRKSVPKAGVTPPEYIAADILTTDYSAGEAHCPSYKAGHRSVSDQEVIEFECEHGTAAWAASLQRPTMKSTKRLQPCACDVLASLAMDSSVIDESSFEDWASSLGYDPDSRNAEAIYRACLETALKLRNGLGEKALAALREACADY